MKFKNLKLVLALVFFSVAFINTTNAQGQRDDKEKKEPPTFAKLLEEMDADEDGKLAKSEVKGPIKNDFDTIDADEDGFISEEELENAPKPKRRESRN